MSKELLTFLAVLFGAGGGGVAVIGAIRDYIGKKRSTVSAVDANVITVGLARDQLAKDNDRLREEARERDARHREERQEWLRERAELRGEIDALEAKVRGLLDELIALRTRHDDAGVR